MPVLGIYLKDIRSAKIFNYKDVYHGIVSSCEKAEITYAFYNGGLFKKNHEINIRI